MSEREFRVGDNVEIFIPNNAQWYKAVILEIVQFDGWNEYGVDYDRGIRWVDNPKYIKLLGDW